MTVFFKQLTLSSLVAWLLLAGVRGQAPAAQAGDLFRQAVRHFEGTDYAAALHLLRQLEPNHPGNFDIQQLLAIVLDLTGDAQEANRHFKKAVELRPTSGQARTNYATSLMRIGRRQEAVTEFRRALEADPNQATASFNLGTLLLQDRAFREALPWLEKAHSLQPQVYENGYHLALCLFALEQHPRVQEVLETLKPVSPERAEYFLIRALNQRALGQEAEAKSSLEEILPLFAQHPDAHEQVAMLLFGQGLFRQSIPILEAAVGRFPESYAARLNLARAKLETGDSAAARKHAGDALAIRKTAEVHALLGDILEAAADPLAALEHYQEAYRLDPSESNLFAVGFQFLSHWNWKEAEQVFESGVRKWPRSWRLLLGLGAACTGQSEFEKATQMFLRATEADPRALLGYHLLAQSFDQASESFDKAVARFGEFHRQNPEDPWAIYYRALAAFRSGTKGLASGASQPGLADLQRLLAQQPGFVEAQLLLGEVQFQQQRWEAAAAAFEKAVELQPSHVEAHYKLALALQRSGRAQEARQEMARYQSLKKAKEQQLAERVAQTTRFIVELKKP